MLVILFAEHGISGDGDAGKGGAFLRLGVGARPMGMGKAYTALANDIYASYWNPAGLAHLKLTEVGSTYGLMSLGRKFAFLGFGVPIAETFAVGLSGVHLRVEDIERRDSQGNLLGSFADAEYAFSFSASVKVIEQVSVGGNIKFLYHTLADSRAQGFGYDFGVLITPLEYLSFGLVVQDIGSSLKWNTESNRNDKVPTILRSGVALKLANEQIIVVSEIVSTGIEDSFESTKLHGGVEFWPLEFIGTRGGYDGNDWTAGLSFKFSQIRVDYGAVQDRIDLGLTHFFSISIGFIE